MTSSSFKPPSTRLWPSWLIMGGLLIVGVLAIFWWRGTSAAPPLFSPDPVTAAWAKAKTSGSYDFSADMTQVTIPTASVTNVGRSSQTEQVHIEGQTNLKAQTMEMHLYADGSSVLNQDGGMALKVENGKTLVRKGTGIWQEEPGVSADSLAPSGDFMAFLSAVHEIKANAPEQRAGIHFTRYSFTIDGPKFALYVRDQLEAAMVARGDLAPGMNIDVPTYYRDMTGTGELWVGTNGLPLRQILTLQFPEQKEQQVHAQITVNFSNFGKDATVWAQSTSQLHSWLYQHLGWQLPTMNAAVQVGMPWLSLAVAMALVIFLLYHQRRRAVYNAVTLSVIASIVLGPVLSTLTSVTAFDRYSARAQAQAAAQAEQQALQDTMQLPKEAFNPHMDPLAAAEQKALDGVELSRSARALSPNSSNLILGVAAAAANAAALPVGASSWWRGENSASDQINTEHGVINGAVTYATGLVGKAFSFNGSNGYVALPDNLFPAPTNRDLRQNVPFSFELWFKTGSGGVILGQQNSVVYTNPTGWINAIYVGTDGKLRASMFGGAALITSVGTVNNNVFRHVAVTYDGTTQRLYLDGALVGSTTYVQQAYANRYRYQLGTGYTSVWPAGITGWYNFNGIIDEPTFYNRALTAGEVTDIFNAGSAGKTPYPATDNGRDVDGDGLTDFQEARLGTNADNPDTDGDSLSDNDEVRGFSFGGKTWYSDPLDADLDSNNDGLADGQERDKDKNGVLDDTDSDGTPDLFDADNDNDGVPDRKDLSPFSKTTAANNGAFTDAAPFKLTMRNLTANMPTFVDFQLRPKDPQHLWYAQHVLDWPIDSAGQVQDIDKKSFADVAAAEGRVVDPSQSLGDLKLVPMLEIRLNGTNTNLPTQNELTPYGISVRNLTADGSSKSILVPLSIVQDETSGARVAFSGRMRYLPVTTWPIPHEVRLAWVVQSLLDLPCNPQAADASAKGCLSDGYIHNVPNPIQVYYDEFTLTGMHVTEERGASMAVIYEDPAVDTNKKDDYPLVALSYGLTAAFLTGRDADSNGARDLDLNEVVRRFDRTQNGAVSETQRWAIPNILRVEKKDYAFYDQALMTTAMTETTRILNDKFNGSWLADKSIVPYLLFASEQRIRTLNLDSGISFNADGMLIDFSPGGIAISESTYASVKGQPYCAPSASTPLWQPCTTDAYWDELDRRYQNVVSLPDDVTPDLARARLMATKIYFMGLNQGSTALIKDGQNLVSSIYILESDTALEKDLRLFGLVVSAGIPALLNQVVMAKFTNNETAVAKVLVALADGFDTLRQLPDVLANPESRESLKNLAKEKFKDFGVKLKSLGATRSAAVKTFAVTAVLAGISVFLAEGLPRLLTNASAPDARTQAIGIKLVVAAALTYVGIISPIQDLLTALKSPAFANVPLGKALGMRADHVGSSVKAGIAGAVLGIAVAWGFFIYSVISNNLTPFSPAFNKALAETVAATIYLILVAAISATIVGAIIMGIIGVIDFILTAVCELQPGNKLRDAPGLGGACFTLGTAAIKTIAYFLYNFDVMIDLTRDDLVITGVPVTKLKEPTKGFVAGNPITLTMPVTTTIRHKDPDPANGLYIYPYLWFFSQNNLKSSAFSYGLSLNTSSDLSGVAGGSMDSLWRVEEDHKYNNITPMYRGQMAQQVGSPAINLTAGLNRPAQSYFNLGYAVPSYECFPVPNIIPPFLPPVIPVCYTKFYNGGNSSQLDLISYDVFPATIDGFMTMGTKSGGRGLAWDNAFTALADSDNDGLLSLAQNGLDPDDTKWDSDNDGLSDTYELTRRQDGVAFSATQCDTDSDGLPDGLEVQLGTNPAARDSDGDGLIDGDEVWHQVFNATCTATGTWSGGWDIPIGGSGNLVARISSNPNETDADGDGLSDLAEKQLVQSANTALRVDKYGRPYHPNVFNINPINVIVNVSDADRVLYAGQYITYTTQVIADVPLAPSVVDISTPGMTQQPPPQALNFDPTTFVASQSVANSVRVLTGQTAGKYVLSSNLRARLGLTTTVAPWTPSPLTVQSISGSPTRPWRTAAAAPVSGKADPFWLALTNQTQEPILGDVRLYKLPNNEVAGGLNWYTSATPVNRVGESRPNMACNNAGNCLVVWNETIPSTIPGVTRESRVAGVLLGASGNTQILLDYTKFEDLPGNAPTVATDGNKFLVVYDRLALEGTSTVRTWMASVLINADGTISSLPGSNANTDSTSTLSSGSFIFPISDYKVNWIGDRYRITRKRINQSTIVSYDMSSAGKPVGTLNVTLVSDAQSVGLAQVFTSPHGYAYDPGSGRSMLVYTKSNGNVQGVVYQGASTTALASRDLGRGEVPQLAFDPNSRSFFHTIRGNPTSTAYSLLDNNLNQIGAASSLAWGGTEGVDDRSLSLACPLANDAPLVNLRFEDLPGATSFLDSSLNNNAVCTGNFCPTPGQVGAVDKNNVAGNDNPWGLVSDYSASFTGGAQNTQLSLSKPISLTQFTLAFWFKGSTSQFSELLFHTASDPNFPGVDDLQVNLTASNGQLYVQLGQNTSKVLRTIDNVNDGKWHYAVITRVPTTSITATNMQLYVDGTLVSTTTGDASTGGAINNKTLRIGGVTSQAFRGSLDGVQLYSVALDTARINALYNRNFTPSCVAVIPRITTFSWSRVQLLPQEIRGGKITASASISVTIDTTAPTVNVTSFSNNQYIQGVPANAPAKVIQIGGTASDATSYVTLVDVAVNGGFATRATGTSTWVYPLLVNEGQYNVQASARDAGDNLGVSTSVRLIADATAPQLTINPPANPTSFSALNPQGKLQLRLSGTVSDPAIGAVSGSGVVATSVEVALEGRSGLVPGTDWQRATLAGNAWSINYQLPDGIKNPTDIYTVTLRAADAVGNRSQATTSVVIDNNGPDTQLTATDVSSGLFTDTIRSAVSIGGLITETGGSTLSLINVALTPITQTLVLSNTLVKLDFSASSFLINGAANGKDAYCPAGARCPDPNPGITSRLDDRAVSFVSLPAPSPSFALMVDAAVKNSFTAAYWVKATANANNSAIVLDQGANVTNGWTMSFDQGRPAFLVNTAEYLVSPNRIDDNQWHFVTGVRNLANGTMSIYVDGVLTASRVTTTSALTAFNNLRIGTDRSSSRRFIGLFDSLRIFNRALSLNEIRALQAESTKPWYSQTIPAGRTTSAWQLALPTNLENIYQIDLVGQDQIGNARFNNYAWRGVIDMVNPRVTLTGQATGQSYLDTATNTTRYEIAYTCRAVDFQLDEASFNCAGNAQRPPAKSFNSDPILQAQFPDLTLLTTLVNTYTVWADSPTPTGSLTACDAYGHCTTANVNAAGALAGGVAGSANDVTAAELVEAAAATAVGTTILAPTTGSVVNSTGPVPVSMAAKADQPLKEIVILLDGAPVSTISFAQNQGIKESVQTAAVTVNTAGTHTVSARTTDWSGAQSQSPTVRFVVDRQPPTVTLVNTQLTKADSYGAQSNILRFRGTASDDAELAAVQVKVGDQAYADANFGGGQWRIAYPVSDPEGKQLVVTVRARDAAGNVTEISQTLGTDLSVADAPDTTLVNKPTDPSNSTSASFTFTGSATAVAFECQLDDAPAVLCSSPWTVSDLSNGRHTFKVAALNGGGFADLTPASHTWSVNVTTLATTLTAQPEATTTSRTASFSFTATGASSFECALDNGKYTACTSPQSYTKLGNGKHTFLVRAKGSTGSPTAGPATRYGWLVNNAAPTVIGNQVAIVVENSAVNVTLQGTDSDPLLFQIVDQPQHGLLLGLAPNLTYVPNTGYAGPDRFTYRAWDGDAASVPAIVNLTVRLGKYAVFAQEGVAFEQNSAVVRGDVGVNVKSAGPFLRNNVEASFSQNSAMQAPTSRVLADSIVVDNNAVIYNPSYNDLTGKGLVNGVRTTPLALPLRSGLPTLPTITPGTQAVVVSGNQTLAAGSYGALTVNGGATLVLSGGLYHFASWNIGVGAMVHFAAPSEVRIAGMVLISQNAFVGPQPGVTTVDANRIILHVAGTDGQSGPGNQPRAVAVDQNATLSAYVVAPNGMINFRQNVIATGVFIAKWVLAEQNSKVTRPADPAFGSGQRAGETTAVDPNAPAALDTPAADATEATLESGTPEATTGVETPTPSAGTVVTTSTVTTALYLPLVVAATATTEATAPTPTEAAAPVTLTEPSSADDSTDVTVTQPYTSFLPLVNQ